MRRLTPILLLLAILSPVVSNAADGRLYKVLPQYLDTKGRDSLTPSLYDRDAYQAVLRDNPAKRSAMRFMVQWKANVTQTNQWKLRVELRGVPEGKSAKLTTLELPLPVHHGLSRWDPVVLGGDAYKTFGDVTAWRVTLWDGNEQVDEQKSFLW